MFGFVFLLSIFLVGYIIFSAVFGERFTEIKLEASFIIGSLIGVSCVFILLLLIHDLFYALLLYSASFSILILYYIRKKRIKNKIKLGKKNIYILLIFFACFLLFERSFSYTNNTFLVSSNLYQDMSAHIPIIRYFSQGKHFIPEVPFFAGSGLLYHFMFDFYTGVLEYLGLRFDIAFNLLSAISMTFLLSLIYFFSQSLFKKPIIGILAGIFFVFNSDLSFLEIIKQNGLSIQKYYHTSTYIFGKLGEFSINGNFLNINVFLNQRQLVFALLVFMFLFYVLIFHKKKLDQNQKILVGILIGLLPFWHMAVLISVYIVLVGLFIFFKNWRKNIIQIIALSLIFVVPQILLIRQNSQNSISFDPGFLASTYLNINNFLFLWVWILGFQIIASAVGFVKSNVFQKKIFLSFMLLFIIANIFKFSTDIFDNHKFFNVWIISINMAASVGILYIFGKSFVFKIFAIALFLLVIMSGILNIVIVKNDFNVKISDFKKSPSYAWISKRAESNSIFLTNGGIYDPLSIAGERTFLGRPRLIYLYGGDPNLRINQVKEILSGSSLKAVSLLKKDGVRYILVYKEKIPNPIEFNRKFLDNTFKKNYEDDKTIIYKI